MKGWLSVAAVVLAYDGWTLATERPTLSQQFAETAEQHPVAVMVGTAYLVAHLYGRWPARLDPFSAFAAACRSLT